MKMHSRFCAGAACAWIAAACLGAAPDSAQVAKSDPARSAKVAQLLRDLTADEKLMLIGGIGFATQPIPRLGIPSFKMSDGPSGTRSPPPSTAYVSGIGLAASWDPDLAREMGVQLGRDARSRGAHFLLGPGVNIYRAPMNGRNFEYLGEDPFLGARIAVGYITGVQSQGVSATIKHFAGNNSEFARHTSDSAIDERALREIYLPVFESAVKEAHVGAVMSAYNLTNGAYMSANTYLVDTVLKREWGFDGLYMSDWGATHDGIAAANARLDLEMPFAQFMNAGTLGAALRDGRVSQATIHDKVARLLGLGARFGWLDRVEPDLSIPRYNQAGRDVARRGALSGTVLLKNAQDLLPLDTSKAKNIAIIGPLAHPAVSTAGGSGHVPAFAPVSFMQGMSDALRNRATVTYSRGIPTLRVLQMMTPFSTAAQNGKPGITVETFGDASFSGAPVSTRVERQFATGAPGFGGDPDFLSLIDSLPPGQMQAILGGMMSSPPKPTFDRWTGWYTPASAGAHTLFVQNASLYRLLIDDRVVIDSSRIPRAMLQQQKIELTPGPHKVVFEQEGPSVFGGPPFWRVGFVREETVVDPMAKQLAARADVVILTVGFDADIETEAADREFALPPGQEQLIREISAVNPNTVVVITSGGSVDVAPWMDRVRAIVAAWYPGQEGGAALASLLLGEANFSGRLPISWERAATDNPSYANYYYNDSANANRIAYREGIFVGYRGYQHTNTPSLFPFGFGLSYTTFRYGDLQVERNGGGAQASFTVSFDVTNTGKRSGAEVAQIYVGAVKPKVPRAPRELKGFARVPLEAGETKRVTIPLDLRSFAYYDVKAKGWRIDAGQYSIELGRSVETIEARAVIDFRSTVTNRPTTRSQ
jgi:beta-glucosidase